MKHILMALVLTGILSGCSAFSASDREIMRDKDGCAYVVTENTNLQSQAEILRLRDQDAPTCKPDKHRFLEPHTRIQHREDDDD